MAAPTEATTIVDPRGELGLPSFGLCSQISVEVFALLVLEGNACHGILGIRD